MSGAPAVDTLFTVFRHTARNAATAITTPAERVAEAGRLCRPVALPTGSGHGSCRSGTTLSRRSALIAPARFRMETQPVRPTIEEATAAAVGPPSR